MQAFVGSVCHCCYFDFLSDFDLIEADFDCFLGWGWCYFEPFCAFCFYWLTDLFFVVRFARLGVYYLPLVFDFRCAV